MFRTNKKLNKSFSETHLLYWLSKITDACAGRIDEFNLTERSLPQILAKIQNGAKIMDIQVAKKHTNKVREYLDGLDKQLNQIERNIRNVL